LVYVDPREFEEGLAERAGIIIDKVYIKISIREGFPKPQKLSPGDNVPTHVLGHPDAGYTLLLPAQSPPR
jgi:hypothetical protein